MSNNTMMESPAPSPLSFMPTFTDGDYYHEDDNYDDVISYIDLFNPVAITLVPKIPALISIICSSVLIHEIYLDIKSNSRRRGDQRVIPNMLVSLSIADISLGISWFFGASLAPKDEPGLWGNFGNVGTCTVVGIFMQFGMLASALCNLGLSFYYLLIVNFNWRDARRIEQIEKWVHLFIWTWVVPLTFVPIGFTMYNFDGSICWVSEQPVGCHDYYHVDAGGAECTRGFWAWKVILFAVAIIVSCVVLCCVNMLIIYLNVRKLEARISKYSGSIRTINQSQNRFTDGSTSLAMGVASSRQLANPNRVRFKNIGEEKQEETEAHGDADNDEDDQALYASVTFIAPTEDNTSKHMEVDGSQKTNDINDAATQGQNNNDRENDDNNNKQKDTKKSNRLSIFNLRQRDLEVEAQRNINREKSKRVAIQGLWYIGAFLITYAVSLVTVILYEQGIVIASLNYVSYAMLPLDGFFSFYAFCRTRPKMKTKGGTILKQIIFYRGCCKIPKKIVEYLWGCCKKSDTVEIIHA